MLNRGKRCRFAAFLICFGLAAAVNLIPYSLLQVGYLSTFLYMGLIIAWGLTIRQRIILRELRRLLLGECACMYLLFFLRLLRYEFFRPFPAVDRLLWISYYHCFALIPLLSFLAARRVGYPPVRRTPVLEKLLWCLAGLLCVGLLLIYVICRGSPALGGVKLYHLQEAYCFLYLATFETAIQIGLIPVNSGYDALFDRIGIHAAIESGDAPAPRDAAQCGGSDEADAAFRLRRKAIHGGYVVWQEDLSEIRRLNASQERITEELEEENELIRQEEALQATRIAIETKNRSYDRIASSVRRQVLAMEAALNEEAPAEAAFRARLIRFLLRRGEGRRDGAASGRLRGGIHQPAHLSRRGITQPIHRTAPGAAAPGAVLWFVRCVSINTCRRPCLRRQPGRALPSQAGPPPGTRW